jgi:hypothetical protein
VKTRRPTKQPTPAYGTSKPTPKPNLLTETPSYLPTSPCPSYIPTALDNPGASYEIPKPTKDPYGSGDNNKHDDKSTTYSLIHHIDYDNDNKSKSGKVSNGGKSIKAGKSGKKGNKSGKSKSEGKWNGIWNGLEHLPASWKGGGEGNESESKSNK